MFNIELQNYLNTLNLFRLIARHANPQDSDLLVGGHGRLEHVLNVINPTGWINATELWKLLNSTHTN